MTKEVIIVFKDGSKEWYDPIESATIEIDNGSYRYSIDLEDVESFKIQTKEKPH